MYPQFFSSLTKEIELKLRSTLLNCYENFNFYRRRFKESGVTYDDLASGSPVEIMSSLPMLGGDSLPELSSESISSIENIVDMETSSGTTGDRKKRFISQRDDLSDHRLMAEMFRFCSINQNDRVVWLDTDPAYLMISFARALDLLGVEEVYNYAVGPDFRRELAKLPPLEPTTIFTVPSLLERSLAELEEFQKGPSGSVQKIVFLGERVPNALRTRLEKEWEVEVFSYYWAAETSSLGIECTAHEGIHLFTTHNLFEVTNKPPELVVTSLKQATLPLLRYKLGDLVDHIPGECRCGSSYPRVKVNGRVGDTFTIFGSDFHYESLLQSMYRDQNEIGFMQINITRTDRDVLTIVVPEEQRVNEKFLKQSLLKEQMELDFLVASRFVDLQFLYVDQEYFQSARKMKLVTDRRPRL